MFASSSASDEKYNQPKSMMNQGKLSLQKWVVIKFKKREKWVEYFLILKENKKEITQPHSC